MVDITLNLSEAPTCGALPNDPQPGPDDDWKLLQEDRSLVDRITEAYVFHYYRFYVHTNCTNFAYSGRFVIPPCTETYILGNTMLSKPAI